jgi:hypothetical protein
MKLRLCIAGIVISIASAALIVSVVRAQEGGDKPGQPSPADMAAMMDKMKHFIRPGDNHKLLERFVGKWETQTRMFMPRPDGTVQAGPPEKGASEVTWLIPGYWIRSDLKGPMMGRPFHIISTMGYDNFKMSFVTSTVSNMDTAMRQSEGDMDPSGKVLITYGTLDEYLTGEHDKMVKYVWRFDSDDKIVLEIHDLPIGEKNTKVLEIVSTRAK